MKKTTLMLGALVLGLGIVGISASTASAYRGDPSVKGKNYSVERHEAMTKAFEEKNYDAWKNLMTGKGNVTRVINKDNFNKFVELHTLLQQGKTEEAQKIRQELGLGLHDGSRNGSGRMQIGKGCSR